MRHFALSLHSDQPAPNGAGDAVSWFRFYKLDADDHVWVPRGFGLEEASVGDKLWFYLDDILIGYAPILRVEPDALNGWDELWFDSRAMKRVEETSGRSHRCFIMTGPIEDGLAEVLLDAMFTG